MHAARGDGEIRPRLAQHACGDAGDSLHSVAARDLFPSARRPPCLKAHSMPALDYLKSLIEFPSVSCTSNFDVSRWLEDRLKALGFETEWLEYTDRAGVAKACITGRRGPVGEGWVHCSHTDVVPVSSWSFPKAGPWEPLVTDDRVYGRGSCDMKGSLACALAAIASFGDQPLKRPFYILSTADEEAGQIGAKNVVERSAMFREIVASGSRAIIGEPTSMDVVHGHKGGHGMKIIAKGRAAHSSTSEGINANLAMIPFLTELRELWLTVQNDPAWRDERFERPDICMNVGINDHTFALNITPPQSICTILFRAMPDQDGNALTERIRQMATRHGLEMEILFQCYPLFTDPGSDFVRELLAITGCPASRTVGYGTDGGFFSEIKRRVVLGPGDICQAHTDDEWISLEQLQRGTDVYRTLIERWCLADS